MIKRATIIFAVAVLALCGALTAHALVPKPQQDDFAQGAKQTSIRFEPVEVWIDTKSVPLAAYQIEISAIDRAGKSGGVQIVGIEGGSHAKFADPPYYDPLAMQHERVIIADFSTAAGNDLPTGRTRLVTLHLQIAGNIEPAFDTKLIVAADVDGKPIAADVELTFQGSES